MNLLMNLFWTIKEQNHVYLFYKGELIYKRWVGKNGGTKTQPSIILNEVFPNEWIIP